MFEIYLLEKPSLKTAITSMYMSKGNEQKIINDIQQGNPIITEDRMNSLYKWGIEVGHNKLIENIHWSYLVKGLSRGTYDDLRTHGTFSTFVAKSTRYCDKFEIAPWFKKQWNNNELIDEIGFINAISQKEDNNDIKRGHYSLAIDTPFTIKTNLHHFMYMDSMRGANSHAHPELQLLIEELKESLNVNDKECQWVYDVIKNRK